MALVAVEAAGLGLVAVAGIGIDRADDPVGRHPPGDAEGALAVGLEVLAQQRREQRGGLGEGRVEGLPLERGEQRGGIGRDRVDERLAGGGVLPVDGGLAAAAVVVVATEEGAEIGLALAATRSRPRMPERSRVTVSIVATASYSGVESSTRRRPTRPASRAAPRATSKMRSG